jgi:hypothetical protein
MIGSHELNLNNQEYTWNTDNQCSGLIFDQLETETSIKTTRMLLLKLIFSLYLDINL